MLRRRLYAGRGEGCEPLVHDGRRRAIRRPPSPRWRRGAFSFFRDPKEDSMTNPIDTNELDGACDRRIVRAGFQGREGSFGARAAARCGRPVPLETFDALLAALASGEIDEALLPATDRVIGPVEEALSALARAVD